MKISELPVASTLSGTDVVAGNVGGVTSQIPVSLFGGGGGGAAIVTAIKTDAYSVTSGAAGAWEAVPGLSVTLSPGSTIAKVVLMAMISLGPVADTLCWARISRNGTVIAQGDSHGTEFQVMGINAYVSDSNLGVCYPINIVDVPGVTTPVTYIVEVMYETRGGSRGLFVNRTAADTDNGTFGQRSISTLTAIG